MRTTTIVNGQTKIQEQEIDPEQMKRYENMLFILGVLPIMSFNV